jgi:hypothetical protein
VIPDYPPYSQVQCSSHWRGDDAGVHSLGSGDHAESSVDLSGQPTRLRQGLPGHPRPDQADRESLSSNSCPNELQGRSPQPYLFQTTIDHLERRHLLSHEEDAPPLSKIVNDHIRNRLRLASASGPSRTKLHPRPEATTAAS